MLTPEIIAKKLDGSPQERRELAREVLGHIDRAVHYALQAARHVKEPREDLVAEVMLYIYRDDARVLRNWDPTRAGLRGYLNMIGGRHVFRRRARQPQIEPLSSEEDMAPSEGDVDAALAYRSALDEICDWVAAHGSDKDRARFEGLLVEGYTVAEMAEHEGGSTEAIYTWLSRFKRRVTQALPHLAEVLEHRS